MKLMKDRMADMKTWPTKWARRRDDETHVRADDQLVGYP
jgi:hypothetical protein